MTEPVDTTNMIPTDPDVTEVQALRRLMQGVGGPPPRSMVSMVLCDEIGQRLPAYDDPPFKTARYEHPSTTRCVGVQLIDGEWVNCSGDWHKPDESRSHRIRSNMNETVSMDRPGYAAEEESIVAEAEEAKEAAEERTQVGVRPWYAQPGESVLVVDAGDLDLTMDPVIQSASGAHGDAIKEGLKPYTAGDTSGTIDAYPEADSDS